MATEKQIEYLKALDRKARSHGYFLDEEPPAESRLRGLTTEQASETIQAYKRLVSFDNYQRHIAGRGQITHRQVKTGGNSNSASGK